MRDGPAGSCRSKMRVLIVYSGRERIASDQSLMWLNCDRRLTCLAFPSRKSENVSAAVQSQKVVTAKQLLPFGFARRQSCEVIFSAPRRFLHFLTTWKTLEVSSKGESGYENYTSFLDWWSDSTVQYNSLLLWTIMNTLWMRKGHCLCLKFFV